MTLAALNGNDSGVEDVHFAYLFHSLFIFRLEPTAAVSARFNFARLTCDVIPQRLPL